MELPGGALVGAGAVAVLLFVGGDAFGQRVSMDAEHDGRLGKVLFVPGEGLLYIELLKFPNRLVEEDVAFQHFVN